MAIYTGTNSFYCYGCGVGGDIVTLVEKLFNLEPLEAAQKLNDDFRLNLIGIELTAERKELNAAIFVEKELEREQADNFKTWEHTYLLYLSDNIRLLDKLERASKPKNAEDFQDNYVYAVNRKQLLEYHWSILFSGEFSDKISLFLELTRAV